MCCDCRQWKIVVIMINVNTMILTRSTKPFRRGRRRRWRCSGARPLSGTAVSRRPAACIPSSFCVAWTQNTLSEKASWHRYCVFYSCVQCCITLFGGRCYCVPRVFCAGRFVDERRHHRDVRAGPPDNDNEYGIVKQHVPQWKKLYDPTYV